MESLQRISPLVFLLFCFFILEQIGFDKVLLILAGGFILYVLLVVAVGLFLAAVIVKDKIVRQV